MYCFGRCRIKTCSQKVDALPLEKQVCHLDIVNLVIVTTAQLHFTRSLNKNAHLNSTYLNYRSATRRTTLRLFCHVLHKVIKGKGSQNYRGKNTLTSINQILFMMLQDKKKTYPVGQFSDCIPAPSLSRLCKL
jgi:hypothetical protein